MYYSVECQDLFEHRLYATALHEITHYISLNAPKEEYNAFKNEIVRWLMARGMLKQYLDKYASMYGDNVATVDDLTEEVVANAAEALIKSDTFLEQLMLDEDFIGFVSNNKAKSFIKRVMEKFGSLVKALKSYLKSADVNHSIARDIAKDVNELEKMSELWTKAFKSAVKNHSEVQSIAKENTDTESSGVRYSIEEDADGNKYVEVDEDIFANSDGETIAKTIARVIKDKFNNLIEVHGQKFKINKTTNDEWRRSERATILMKKSPSVYFDKLRTIANADELLEAANNWIGEALKHERKDKIVEFARGNINFKVGDNGYSADVIVGISSDGSAVLYDLIDIREKNITEAQVTKAEKNRLRRQDTSVIDNNIPQTSEDVKKKLSISEDMTEQERYEELKDKIITLSYPDMDKIEDIDLENYRTMKTIDAKKPIKKIADMLGISNINYQNSNIDFDFSFSRKNLNISLNHQQEYGGDYADYIKLLSCINELIENAELIEIHDNYKDNNQLKQTYVLVSAFNDGSDIAPVQFEVKEYYGADRRLYLSVVLTKIKKSAVIRESHDDLPSASTPLVADSIISLPQLFANVNPADKRFLKYVPDGFLSDEQIKAKREAQYSDYIKHGRYAELFEGSSKLSLPEPDTASFEIPEKIGICFSKQKRLPEQCLIRSDNRIGDPPGNRTRDTLLKRQVLCRLS